MDKTSLPPGPYIVDDQGDMLDANGEIISMMARAEPCDRIAFMQHLCTAANAHAPLRDACTDMVKWLENPDPATFTKEHILTIIAATKAALALAEGVE